MSLWQVQSLINTSNLVVTLNKGLSKQLTEDVKMKLIDADKAGEGYKKISKRFQLECT